MEKLVGQFNEFVTGEDYKRRREELRAETIVWIGINKLSQVQGTAPAARKKKRVPNPNPDPNPNPNPDPDLNSNPNPNSNHYPNLNPDLYVPFHKRSYFKLAPIQEVYPQTIPLCHKKSYFQLAPIQEGSPQTIPLCILNMRPSGEIFEESELKDERENLSWKMFGGVSDESDRTHNPSPNSNPNPNPNPNPNLNANRVSTSDPNPNPKICPNPNPNPVIYYGRMGDQSKRYLATLGQG
jgi:hypothetical protein